MKNREISPIVTQTIMATDYRSTEISLKNRQNRRNIGEAPINRRKIASGSDGRSNRRYFYRFFGKFPDISYQVGRVGWDVGPTMVRMSASWSLVDMSNAYLSHARYYFSIITPSPVSWAPHCLT